MYQLIELLPPHLRKIEQFNELFNIDEKILKDFVDVLEHARSNNFVQTCDEVGIKKFEDILEIVATPTDTLEFRRLRVLNRLSMKPPFSTPFLRSRLDVLLGQYELKVDYDNYTIYIESFIENVAYFNELTVTLTDIKPCNIAVVFTPLIKQDIKLNSEISYFEEKWNYVLNGDWLLGKNESFRSSSLNYLWNYKLNGSWVLGNNKSFAKEEGRYILKPREQKSFNLDFLNLIKDNISKSITKVIIRNNEGVDFEITSFIQNSGGILEYSIPKAVGNVSNIKVYADDIIVEDLNVFWINYGADTNIKHSINVLEGV